MIAITALWLPILIAAVLVFVASSVSHMVIKFHAPDYERMPSEDRIMEVLRKEGVGPGNYVLPCPSDPAAMKSPEFLKKYEQGPVGFFNVMPSGVPAIATNLIQWFAWLLLVGVFVAYIAGRTLGPGTEYLQVFRVTGATAFVAYVLHQPVASIWAGRKWGPTLRHAVDGVIYSLLTAGTFGWLWPDA